MNFTLQSGNQGAGAIPGQEAVVDRLRGSTRASLSPLDHLDLAGTILGHYRANLVTGATVSIAALGPLLSFRWAQQAIRAVLLKFAASPSVATAVTAATPFDLELIRASAWTVNDTTGTATGVPSKNRSNMSASAVADLRVATTAAITAGTRTLDSLGFAHQNFPPKTSPDIGATGATALAAGTGSDKKTLYEWTISGEHPEVFELNEGFVARLITAGPTTGTVRWAFEIAWAELAYF